MGDDQRDRGVEAGRAELAPGVKRTQELAAAVYGLLRTQTQHVLEVAGIVFGLTIAFVVPERSITTTELWFLGAAILLLGASIVLGLIVILDAVANVARLQHQSDETTSPENEVKKGDDSGLGRSRNGVAVR
jgi:hypothetical protein